MKVVPTATGEKVSGYIIKYTRSYNADNEITSTDKYISALFGKYTNNCFMVYSDYGNFDDKGEWKPNIYGEIYCDSGGGGGSGGGDGGGSSGDGGGSGGGGGAFTPSQQNPNPNPAPPNQNGATINPQDVVLMPAYPLPIDVPTFDPCVTIKPLLNDPVLLVKPLIIELKTKVNDAVEAGYSLKRNITSGNYNPLIAELGADANTVQMQPGGNYYGGVHIHCIT